VLRLLRRSSGLAEEKYHRWRRNRVKVGLGTISSKQWFEYFAETTEWTRPYIVGFKKRCKILQLAFIGHLFTFRCFNRRPSIFSGSLSALDKLEIATGVYMCLVPNLTRLFPFLRASAKRVFLWRRNAAERDASFLAFRSKTLSGCQHNNRNRMRADAYSGSLGGCSTLRYAQL
jgi:hypothetical protein